MPDPDPTEFDDVAKGKDSPRQRFPWLVLVLAIVLMPLASFLLTELVLIPRIKEAVDSGSISIAQPQTQAPVAGNPSTRQELPHSHEFRGIVVNVAGTMGTRFLKISFKVASNQENISNRMEKHRAAILDAVLSTLSTRTLTELEGPGVRNAIRQALIENINDVAGTNTVQELYFTEFIVQ